MTVRVERAGNRILVGSDTRISGLGHQIPGAYWRDNTEVWSVPLDLTTCALLREKFGTRLKIGPGLWEWAVAEKARREQAESIVAAADAKLELLPKVAPELFAAMDTRRYQRAGVRYIVDTQGRDGRKRALLADTVGLGKSAQALGAVLENGKPGPYLIVCPKTAVQSTWAGEIRKWLPEDEVITFPDLRKERENILNNLVGRANNWTTEEYGQGESSLQRTWVIVHPVMVRTQTWFICGECGSKTKYKVGPVDELSCGHEKDRTTRTEDDHNFPQLFGIDWSAIVVDESDQILIRLTGTPNLQRRGMELLRDLVPVGGLRLAMSGTPFRSKPFQIWSTLNWLDPVRWSGKWRFIQNYWATGGYSGYEIIKDGFYEEREALLIDELRDVMLRRTRDMVRPDLPAKLYPSNVSERDGLTPGIYLPMDKEQARAYQEMVKTGTADIDGGELNAIGVLSEMTRLRQFATSRGRLRDGNWEPIPGGNKWEWLLEFLSELGFPDKPSTKLVVVSQFTKLLNAFAAGVSLHFDRKVTIGKITGEQNARIRQDFIQRFEDLDDPLSLMFLNVKAGGSSITLDAAEVMVMLDETQVADEQEQVEGRIDNRQPERRIVPRSYYYLRSLGTIEEHIAAANAEAKRMGRKVLDGAEIARRARELINGGKR